MPVANRILFIVADDLGYGDLHPHHAWLRKPALDAALVAFGALGVVFVVACFLPCVVRRLRRRPRGGRRRLKDEDEPPAASATAAPAEVELSEARRPARIEFDL